MNNEIRIVPSILTDSPETLRCMLYESEKFTDFVQIDIMDGWFVPSLSITAIHIFQIKTMLKWEAHLMVKDPENYIKDFSKAGAQRLIFHYEAAQSPASIIIKIKEHGLKAGIAINPETAISEIYPLIDMLDCVYFMSVHPGFYGSKFLPEVLPKITEFHKLYPGIETGMDGGIKENNISLVARTGVNSICVGSAIFCQKDPTESYRHLEALAQGDL
ncbi:MAG: ribulose-phosphate 3-epimerase [Dehalococcoidales bacterium]|nr:ribulose-phosphate 3-epimerase [Dehalococcoidales bacterium]